VPRLGQAVHDLSASCDDGRESAWVDELDRGGVDKAGDLLDRTLASESSRIGLYGAARSLHYPAVRARRAEVAILVVYEVAGMTAEQDAAMVKALDLDSSPPVGWRIRMAGPTAVGWRVLNLWDSEHDFERFRDDRLTPSFTAASRAVPPFEVWPIETVDTAWEI
jgi:hypothetical protein